MNFGKWLGFSCLVIALYILWQIHQLLLLIFSAVVLATALNRFVRKLMGWGVPQRGRAVALTIGLVVVMITLFFWLIVPPFVDQFQKLIDLLPTAFTQVRSQIVALERFSELAPDPPTWKEVVNQLQPLGVALLSFFSSSVATVLQLFLVVVLTLMMLANPQEYRQAFIKLFPSFYRSRTDGILKQCEVALSSWLEGMVINCLFIGTMSAIGLVFFGVDLVLVHALLAGVLNMIPNIGPFTSAIFPIMVALLDAPWKVVAVLVWYLLIQNIESYWLSPTVMAKQVSLLPAVTLTAQIFFAQAFGLLGLILALPLTVVAKVWVEEVLFADVLDRWHQSTTLGIGAISGRSPLAPETLPPITPQDPAALPESMG